MGKTVSILCFIKHLIFIDVNVSCLLKSNKHILNHIFILKIKLRKYHVQRRHILSMFQNAKYHNKQKFQKFCLYKLCRN